MHRRSPRGFVPGRLGWQGNPSRGRSAATRPALARSRRRGWSFSREREKEKPSSPEASLFVARAASTSTGDPREVEQAALSVILPKLFESGRGARRLMTQNGCLCSRRGVFQDLGRRRTAPRPDDAVPCLRLAVPAPHRDAKCGCVIAKGCVPGREMSDAARFRPATAAGSCD